MDKMHISGHYILGVISMTSSYDMGDMLSTRVDSSLRTKQTNNVNFNYLPPNIKFGAFRLKLAHKMQESPEPDRLQWTYRLYCTDTIYAILMTSRRETQVGDQVIFISYPLKFDLV